MDIPERGRAADNRPYFFLSYAHTPPWGPGGGDPDHWVHVLFRDLCDHIMALTDLPAGAAAGFMDREMRSGDGWPDKLSENLALCRVFVPLFSPRYFTSEMCGREWYAFNERIVQAKTAGAGDVPAIVPALWTHVPFGQLPDSVRHIHIEHSPFGERYLAHGIYGLIKLKRLKDEYDETVLALAQRIVRVAHESPLPSTRPRPYETTPSAFKPRGEGPRSIHLTVAAPTRHTVPEHRDTRPYGEDARDWNPYHGESTRPLPALAEELIRSLDYRITVSDFDDGTLGKGFPGTLSCAKSLAVSLRRAGLFEDAHRLTTATRAQYRAQYSAPTPDSLACDLNKASDLYAADEPEEARLVAREALTEYMNVPGERPPYTQAALNNLGIYHWACGDADEAEGLFRRITARMSEVLSDQHPHTLFARANLANVLAESGRLEEAWAMEEPARDALLAILGPQHPEALGVVANSTLTLRALGRSEEAERLRQETLAELLRQSGQMGPENGITQLVSGERRVYRDLEPLAV